MHVPPQIIAVGLLHDTVEDTEINLDDLQRDFGVEIAKLVDAVTKLTTLPRVSRSDQFAETQEEQNRRISDERRGLPDDDARAEILKRSRKYDLASETLRKTFLAMAEDPRVVLIKLAERTQKATSEISVSINTMKQESGSIMEKSEAMTMLAEDVSSSVVDFETTMNELNSDAQMMADTVEDTESEVFIVLAKIDHIIYKANAYNAMVDADSSVEFGTHTECRLGKWLVSTGKERFGQTSSYSILNKPHMIVHTSVHDNMKFLQNGDKRLENEEKIIDNFKAMESSSHALFTILDTMKEESMHSVDKVARSLS
jgi:predicted transcriptional regulator